MEQRDLGANDIRIHYLRVTNNGDTDFTDRYDGVPVTIEAHRSQNLQLDMAAHMFGYDLHVSQDAMFRHTCKRQGWNTPEHLKVQPSGKTLAQELFSRFDIKPVIYKMVEEKVDTDAPIPADPPIPQAVAIPEVVEDVIPEVIEDDIDIPPLPKRKSGAS